MRKIITLFDLSKRELEYLIKRAVELFKGDTPTKKLKEKIGLIYFEKPSTRTRISFEVAVTKLGGTAIYSTDKDTQILRGEDRADFARVLDGYVDFFICRVYDHKSLEIFSESTKKPVINALSNLSHPTQIISDLATIELLLGRYEGKKIVFMGDAKNNVARSWIEALEVLGNFELVFSCPEGFEPELKSRYKIEYDPSEAVKDADIIYTDVWFSMGDEFSPEKEEKMKKYAVDSEKAKYAKLVMHCLPAKKGKEISYDVFEKFKDVIFTQAHMKLYSAISILESIDLE